MNASFVPVAADASFIPRRLHEEPVHAVSRDAARAAWRVYRGADGFEVSVPELVVSELFALARRLAPFEFYALLVGRVCADAHGKHVIVDGAILDRGADAGLGRVETTVESELALRKLAAFLHPTSVPVGWAHPHTRGGTVFSARDLANQATWTQPHSVGIVVDPWNHDPVGVYRGPDAERLVEILPEPKPTPVAPAPEPKATRPAPRLVPFPLLAFVPRRVRMGLAVVGVVVVAGLGFLAHELRELANGTADLEERVDSLAIRQRDLEMGLDFAEALAELAVASEGHVFVSPHDVSLPALSPTPAPTPAAAPPSSTTTLRMPAPAPGTSKSNGSKPPKPQKPKPASNAAPPATATPKDGGA